MNCPFCGKAMEHGEIVGDGRTKIRWEPEGLYPTRLDKIFADPWHGRLTGAVYQAGVRITADFCPTCKKMVFDTDIER